MAEAHVVKFKDHLLGKRSTTWSLSDDKYHRVVIFNIFKELGIVRR